MPNILKLRGAAALSAFRLDKLTTQLARVHGSLRLVAAQYWHFAEVDRPLLRAELTVLERLLEYGEAPKSEGEDGCMLLVVPRLGTISPWSSKATDIARRCGLEVVRRVERGVAYRLAGGSAVVSHRRILPALHDRMTQTVFDDLDHAEALFRHFDPRPLTVAIMARGRMRWSRPTCDG